MEGFSDLSGDYNNWDCFIRGNANMNIKECLEKGYLKKDKPDIAKAKQSLKIAEDKFDGALKAFEAELFESTISFTASPLISVNPSKLKFPKSTM